MQGEEKNRGQTVRNRTNKNKLVLATGGRYTIDDIQYKSSISLCHDF